MENHRNYARGYVDRYLYNEENLNTKSKDSKFNEKMENQQQMRSQVIHYHYYQQIDKKLNDLVASALK